MDFWWDKNTFLGERGLNLVILHIFVHIGLHPQEAALLWELFVVWSQPIRHHHHDVIMPHDDAIAPQSQSYLSVWLHHCELMKTLHCSHSRAGEMDLLHCPDTQATAACVASLSQRDQVRKWKAWITLASSLQWSQADKQAPIRMNESLAVLWYVCLQLTPRERFWACLS